jgi:hypothetical protein
VTKLRRPKSTRGSRSNNTATKPHAYEALSALNQHFEQVLQNLDRLRELGLFDTRFRRESVQACQAMIEETRAWINFGSVEVLHEWEERDRAFFGRIRHQFEDKYQDPHDILLKAERLGKKIATEG